MKKKIYKKPEVVTSSNTVAILPALAAGAALAGGYVIGRVVKSIEIRDDTFQIRSLRRVGEIL